MLMLGDTLLLKSMCSSCRVVVTVQNYLCIQSGDNTRWKIKRARHQPGFEINASSRSTTTLDLAAAAGASCQVCLGATAAACLVVPEGWFTFKTNDLENGFPVQTLFRFVDYRGHHGLLVGHVEQFGV